MGAVENIDKRAFDRRPIDNGMAYIEGHAYHIHDLSHGGFALHGALPENEPEKIYEIKFSLEPTNRQMETRCKIIQMWGNDDMCGFEFYEPTKQQMIDISNYLKAIDAQH